MLKRIVCSSSSSSSTSIYRFAAATTSSSLARVKAYSTDSTNSNATVTSVIKAPAKVAPIVFEAEVLSGVPQDVTNRRVRIYRPAKTAMQSGTALTEEWKLDFDIEPRWKNDLMGWSSSADTVQALRMKFETKEAAILFAERQGYDYTVEIPKEKVFKVRSYSANFKYSAKKLRWQHTK